MFVCIFRGFFCFLVEIVVRGFLEVVVFFRGIILECKFLMGVENLGKII